MKKSVYIAFICLCFGLNIFAQAETKVSKYEQPNYYAPAAALGLQGEFVVAVKIDRAGKVVSTDYEKGHPLLKKTLEEAASKWIFSADKNLEEREVKIIFEYSIKINTSKKNTDRQSSEKAQYKKPFRLIITRTNYPRTSVY